MLDVLSAVNRLTTLWNSRHVNSVAEQQVDVKQELSEVLVAVDSPETVESVKTLWGEELSKQKSNEHLYRQETDFHVSSCKSRRTHSRPVRFLTTPTRCGHDLSCSADVHTSNFPVRFHAHYVERWWFNQTCEEQICTRLKVNSL